MTIDERLKEFDAEFETDLDCADVGLASAIKEFIRKAIEKEAWEARREGLRMGEERRKLREE